MRDIVKRWAIGSVALLCLVIGFGQGPELASAAWPNPNGKVKKTETGQPEILFTFDDGPDHKNTAKVLDILEDHDIQAIFYTVGFRVAHRSKRRSARVDLLDRIVRDGHLIGNHTVNHSHLCKVSKSKAIAEIDRNREIYEELTEMPVFLFRAPYGDRCKRLIKMLRKRGIRHDHWDIDPREWQNASTQATVGNIVRKLRVLRGRAVILMHDTKKTTVRALPKVLDWIEAENVRREKTGRKPIRIIGASEWVSQNWDVGLWNLAESISENAGERFLDAFDRLTPGAKVAKVTKVIP